MLFPPKPTPNPRRLPPILRMPQQGPRFPIGPGGSRIGGLRGANGPMGPPPQPMPTDMGPGFEGSLPNPQIQPYGQGLPGLPNPQIQPYGQQGPPRRDVVLPGAPGGGMGQPPVTLPQLRQQLAALNLMQMLARLGKHHQAHVGHVTTDSANYPGTMIPGSG